MAEWDHQWRTTGLNGFLNRTFSAADNALAAGQEWFHGLVDDVNDFGASTDSEFMRGLAAVEYSVIQAVDKVGSGILGAGRLVVNPQMGASALLGTMHAVQHPVDTVADGWERWSALSDQERLEQASAMLAGLGAVASKAGQLGRYQGVDRRISTAYAESQIIAAADDLVNTSLAGGDTSAIAASLAREFTRSAPGANQGAVILGRWRMSLGGEGTSSVGYIDLARLGGGTWFETPGSFWPALKDSYVRAGVDPKLAVLKADDADFLVNKQFLLQQAEVGATFRLSNTTPHHAEQYFRSSATMREIDLLNSEIFKALGYARRGNSWVKSGGGS